MSTPDDLQITPDAGPSAAATTGTNPKVRTLSEPPEIWDLVHETREEFKPGSAFFGHFTTIKSLVLTVILLVIVGGTAYWFVTSRSSSGTSPAAPTVPTETSRSVLSPSPALPNQPTTDQSTTKAPAPAAPLVNTVAEPKPAPVVPAASSETKVSNAPSDTKVIAKPRPPNSPTATGESVAARNKEKARVSKLTVGPSPTALRTDRKDSNQALATPAPKSDKQQGANPTVTKKESDKAQSPPPVAPAKANATPKPKVIPWP
jgi:type IV secretory pathway VirB10-like protein